MQIIMHRSARQHVDDHLFDFAHDAGRLEAGAVEWVPRAVDRC